MKYHSRFSSFSLMRSFSYGSSFADFLIKRFTYDIHTYPQVFVNTTTNIPKYPEFPIHVCQSFPYNVRRVSSQLARESSDIKISNHALIVMRYHYLSPIEEESRLKNIGSYRSSLQNSFPRQQEWPADRLVIIFVFARLEVLRDFRR
jgi:hypothetical protein